MFSTARSKTFKVCVRAATEVKLWESSISNELKIAFTLKKKCQANAILGRELLAYSWHLQGLVLFWVKDVGLTSNQPLAIMSTR